MKKIFLSLVATMIMSGVAVYADGGKKAARKHVAKKECTKCPDKTHCNKATCPDFPGCICH